MKIRLFFLAVCFMFIAQLPTFAGRVGPSFGDAYCDCETSQVPCYDDTGIQCNQHRVGPPVEAFTPNVNKIRSFTEHGFVEKGKAYSVEIRTVDARINVDESFLDKFSIFDAIHRILFTRFF